MRILRLLYIIIGVASANLAFAQDSARYERATIANLPYRTAWQNPAVYGTVFRFTQNELMLTAHYSHASAPLLLEKGDGHSAAEAKTTAYIRLSNHTTVWGKAAYTTTRTSNIRWNSTSDYDLLAPYVLADTVGGNTQGERYTFSGGYATAIGKWNVGAEMLFRAEQEWRNRDPRMRGIVSDLTIKVGAAYQTAGNYQLGAALSGNIYKQSNDVDLYNEQGGAAQYVMTGLGTHYKRFSGFASDVNYTGSGTTLLLSAQPLTQRGFYGDITLESSRYKRISNEYNSLPLTTLYNNNAAITAGYRNKGVKSLWTAFAHYAFDCKHGDEHVAGDAVAGVYPVLADLTMYKHYHTTTYAGAMFTALSKSQWTIGTKLGYISNRSKYVYPSRKINFSHIFTEATTQLLSHIGKRWLTDCQLTAAYFAKANATIDMPYTDMEPFFVQMINYNYIQQRASYGHINARFRTDYKLNNPRYGMFAELQGATTFTSEHKKQTTMSLTMGLTF